MDVIKIETSTEASQFWNAVKIYYQHPNSINKQVLFSEDVIIAELLQIFAFNKCQQFVDNFSVKLLEKFSAKNSLSEAELVECNILQLTDVENAFSHTSKMFFIIRKLFPKLNVNDRFQFFEFIFLDKAAAKVYIFTKSIPIMVNEVLTSNTQSKKMDPYVILKYNFIQLSLGDNYVGIFYQKNFNEKGITWLHAVFSPKFAKLMSSTCKINNARNNKLQFENKVNIVQYYKLYEEMKFKYAKYFVKNWTENTDPKKYVYEDIGIATYLMMLWNGGNIQESSRKQRYIDIGCGNGLLVHILNSEGHLGIGIDIRKRRIWDKYPPSTVLKEETVIPSSKNIYPDADWLIGNHSDELTAWIPIMARLSNKNCQYFVLPCCPYQLNGTKFQRKNSSFSSYQDFLNYVKEISVLCDFETYMDKLRIPSTKKVCLIGVRRSEVSKEKYDLVNDKVIKFISKEFETIPDQDNCNMGNEETSVNMKIRKSVEPVRNCTKLPKEFTNKVLKLVMNELLEEQIICQVIRNGKSLPWNRGRKLPIKELAASLKVDVLKQLKNECKGLQTFLKNHHFIFEVNQGCVQFRSPENMLQLCKKYLETQNEKWKLKKCWFFNNHPDQCPLSTDACSYNHCN